MSYCLKLVKAEGTSSEVRCPLALLDHAEATIPEQCIGSEQQYR